MSKKLSKGEYAQKMKDIRKKVYDDIDEHALDIIRDQEEYVSFLELYSRLNYTVFNTLAVHAVKPDATAINDFAGWKEAGTPVKNKEQGIHILAPDGTYIDSEGNERTSFKVKAVFDVSQTNGGHVEAKSYNLKDVRDSLIFGDEESYEGLSLSDAIDYACKREGEPNDEITIAAAAYALKHRYGVTPNRFEEDVVSYFSDTTEPAGAKSQLREVDKIYKAVKEKIDYGLYIREKEKTDEQQR